MCGSFSARPVSCDVILGSVLLFRAMVGWNRIAFHSGVYLWAGQFHSLLRDYSWFAFIPLAFVIQMGEFSQLVAIGIVFLLGQLLEGTVLSPILVGERVGLHPVVVILAVMAGGQLFGFGVLWQCR